MTILIFYNNEDALERYLDQLHMTKPQSPVWKRANVREYRDYNTLITCYRGLPMDFARAYKAHIVAVEEELTWGDDWEWIRDAILNPIRMTPLPIQIFDSETYDVDAEREELRCKK